MYYIKVYNYYNNLVEQIEEKSFQEADKIAILKSKHLAHAKMYVIIEDENFERLGWYEKGYKIDYQN